MAPQRDLPLLSDSLRASPVVRIKDYDYFVHPITDGIPAMSAVLLGEVSKALARRLPAAFDKILTAEAMGIPLASALTLATGKPFTVARKRAYGLPGEIVVEQRTAYASSRLHVNGVRGGERIVLVDDVVSTGATVRAMAEAVARANARLMKVLLVVNKGHDLDALAGQVGAPVEALVALRVVDGRVLLEP